MQQSNAVDLNVIFSVSLVIFRIARLFDHVDHGVIEFAVRFSIVRQQVRFRTRLFGRTGAQIFDAVLGALLQLSNATAGLLNALLVGRTVEYTVLLFFLGL